MPPVKLTYVGPDEMYNGITDDGAEIRIEKDGPPVEVPPEMGERLLADFPGWFKKGAGAAASSGSPKKKTSTAAAKKK